MLPVEIGKYPASMSQRHPIQNDVNMLVTTVTLNRLPIFSCPEHAREAVEALYRVQSLHPFFLYGFVIMPDHCHFLLKVPPPETVSKIMNIYKSGMTFNVGISKMWQASFHIRFLEDPVFALHYVHANPVRKGLSETPEDYAWSSACGKWDVTEFGCL